MGAEKRRTYIDLLMSNTTIVLQARRREHQQSHYRKKRRRNSPEEHYSSPLQQPQQSSLRSVTIRSSAHRGDRVASLRGLSCLGGWEGSGREWEKEEKGGGTFGNDESVTFGDGADVHEGEAGGVEREWSVRGRGRRNGRE